VDMAFVTEEDPLTKTVHLIVSNHQDLPDHEDGTPFPEVKAIIETTETGGRKLRFQRVI
jgi:hypothetical protein